MLAIVKVRSQIAVVWVTALGVALLGKMSMRRNILGRVSPVRCVHGRCKRALINLLLLLMFWVLPIRDSVVLVVVRVSLAGRQSVRGRIAIHDRTWILDLLWRGGGLVVGVRRFRPQAREELLQCLRDAFRPTLLCRGRRCGYGHGP